MLSVTSCKQQADKQNPFIGTWRVNDEIGQDLKAWFIFEKETYTLKEVKYKDGKPRDYALTVFSYTFTDKESRGRFISFSINGIEQPGGETETEVFEYAISGNHMTLVTRSSYGNHYTSLTKE